MKIGMFLDTSFPPDPRVENEAATLVNAGHQVFLFSLCRKKQKSKEQVNGILVFRYPVSKLTYKLSALVYTFPFFNWLIIPKIKSFIEETQVDYLHVHDMVIAEAVCRANRHFQLRMVLDLHENRPAIMKFYPHLKVFPGNLLISLKKWRKKQDELISNYDRLVLVTREARDVVINGDAKIEADNIYVVPNTINQAVFFSYPLSNGITEKFSNKFNLIYVGDCSLRRGVDTVIKAVSLLVKDIPEINFVVVGTSSELHLLQALVKRLNVEGHVSFEGWQDVSLFPSYMSMAQIGVSPIKRNLHHDTTFANKVFQYMAMGIPLIVSDCPPQANLVKETNSGLVFKAEDEKDLAQAIMKIYRSEKLAREMGENARSAVMDSYHWEVTGKPLIQLYEGLEK